MKIFCFSYDTNTASQPTDTTLSDDDDDELLALRIAALESIKLQKAKPPPQKEATKQTERDEDKPEFQIKKHSIRSNLLSIVTHDEDQETVIPPPSSLNPEAVPFIPVPVNFDPSRPPPGFGGRGGQLLPFPPPRLPGRRVRSPICGSPSSRLRTCIAPGRGAGGTGGGGRAGGRGGGGAVGSGGGGGRGAGPGGADL